MAAADLTAAHLRELLHYDPDSGIFTWRISRGSRRAGQPTGGTPTGEGYSVISLDGKLYRASRLAWLYQTGAWPNGIIDHRDGDRANDKFGNLRDVDYIGNAQNRHGPRYGCASGYLGVHPHRNRWAAAIHVNGRKRHLGTFDTPQAAHDAYLKAKREVHQACTI